MLPLQTSPCPQASPVPRFQRLSRAGMVQTHNRGDIARHCRWCAGTGQHTQAGRWAKQQGTGGACRDKGEQTLRQRKEEEGIINRKLSIPQHLRDRGIAVIRPRGRKLAGLWERKPRLEEAAEESEVEEREAHKEGTREAAGRKCSMETAKLVLFVLFRSGFPHIPRLSARCLKMWR